MAAWCIVSACVLTLMQASVDRDPDGGGRSKVWLDNRNFFPKSKETLS